MIGRRRTHLGSGPVNYPIIPSESTRDASLVVYGLLPCPVFVCHVTRGYERGNPWSRNRCLAVLGHPDKLPPLPPPSTADVFRCATSVPV